MVSWNVIFDAVITSQETVGIDSKCFSRLTPIGGAVFSFIFPIKTLTQYADIHLYIQRNYSYTCTKAGKYDVSLAAVKF